MSNWHRESSTGERRTFWACFGGWALDALDVQMFGQAIPALIAAIGLSKTEAGLLGGVTLFFGANRLLWGSDWPHTQFETSQTYQKTRMFLDTLIPDTRERAMALEAPRALFRF